MASGIFDSGSQHQYEAQSMRDTPNRDVLCLYLQPRRKHATGIPIILRYQTCRGCIAWDVAAPDIETWFLEPSHFRGVPVGAAYNGCRQNITPLQHPLCYISARHSRFRCALFKQGNRNSLIPACECKRIETMLC